LISIDTQTVARFKESIGLGIAPLQTGSLLLDYDHFISDVTFCILAFLKVAEQELPDKEIKVQFGWPMSSWIDRVSIGVMVLNLMRLPRMFPRFDFIISYHKQWPVTTRHAREGGHPGFSSGFPPEACGNDATG
jgi:hypothetical protein